jgi:Ca2+-binding RTX toxin-like protein
MELIMSFDRTITGNDSDNSLRGDSRNENIRGRGGNDILQGFNGDDQLLGGKNDDYLFGGLGNDVLSGDDDLTLGDATENEKGNDILIGGRGADTLIGWGDDILVGSGPNSYNTTSAAFIDNLKNDPFETPIAGDGQQDVFVAVNKQAIDYTLTIAGYEQGIDRIDLRSFGIRSASQFDEIQDKGGWFEAITPEVGGAQLVLRIDVNPTALTYVI